MGCIVGAFLLGQSHRNEEIFLSMIFMIGGGLGFIVCFIPLSVFSGPKTTRCPIPSAAIAFAPVRERSRLTV